VFFPLFVAQEGSLAQFPGLMTLEQLSPNLGEDELRSAFKTLEQQFLKVSSSFFHFLDWFMGSWSRQEMLQGKARVMIKVIGRNIEFIITFQSNLLPPVFHV
jgi:hypothetical protein